MGKLNQKDNYENNERRISKKLILILILIGLLSIVLFSTLIKKSVFSLNNEKSKDEIILQYEQEIKNLNQKLAQNSTDYDELEVKLALERRKNEFEDLFNNPFEGTYLINGKEGKMKLEFQDTLYGTLEFSVNYSTTEEVKQLINKNEVKFKYPNIKFKLNDMDKNNNFITIKGYEITQPAIMNKNEEVLNSEFKMIDGSEIRLLNLRIWYVEGNKIVGDIMDENDNIIGTFNMKIKEVVNNTQNPK